MAVPRLLVSLSTFCGDKSRGKEQCGRDLFSSKSVLFSSFRLFYETVYVHKRSMEQKEGKIEHAGCSIIPHLCNAIKRQRMEKEEIKTITIEDFKANKDIIVYVNDDIVMVDDLKDIPYSNQTIRLECFLIIFCIEGSMQLDINYKTYLLQEGDVLVGLPNTLISRTLISPHHKIRLGGLSTRFLQQIIKREKNTLHTVVHIHNNPVRRMEDTRDENIFQLYRNLIMKKIADKTPHCYHETVIRHLFSALFSELFGKLNQEISTAGMDEQDSGRMNQGDYILRRFMELLGKDEGMHRSVSYFADAMCYSPKHLSKVIKDACGKTPLKLINESSIECIKYRLKRSDKSIKEISDEFNFPNQSFFGKYVKAHLGMSPAQYRNQKGE